MIMERDLPVRVSLGPRWQLMFVDLHIEMLSGTRYQHLVSPIIDNVHTIAMQITNVVDNPGMKECAGGAGTEQLGIINTKFWFGYQAVSFGDYMEPINEINCSPAGAATAYTSGSYWLIVE